MAHDSDRNNGENDDHIFERTEKRDTIIDIV